MQNKLDIMPKVRSHPAELILMETKIMSCLIQRLMGEGATRTIGNGTYVLKNGKWVNQKWGVNYETHKFI